MATAQGSERGQCIAVQARSAAQLTGVSDVVRFEETVAVFDTTQGALTIEGEGLRIVRLSLETGEVDLAGKVSGLFYDEPTVQTGGFLRRLFSK